MGQEKSSRKERKENNWNPPKNIPKVHGPLSELLLHAKNGHDSSIFNNDAGLPSMIQQKLYTVVFRPIVRAMLRVTCVVR